MGTQENQSSLIANKVAFISYTNNFKTSVNALLEYASHLYIEPFFVLTCVFISKVRTVYIISRVYNIVGGRVSNTQYTLYKPTATNKTSIL